MRLISLAIISWKDILFRNLRVFLLWNGQAFIYENFPQRIYHHLYVHDIHAYFSILFQLQTFYVALSENLPALLDNTD